MAGHRQIVYRKMGPQRTAPRRLRLIRSVPDPGDATDMAPPAVTLDSLYREHAAFVARLAFRLLGREAEVDDVVHDVFVDLMRRFSQLRDAHELRGWLATVTTRTARRRLRRSRVRQWVGLDSMAPADDIRASSGSVQDTHLLRSVYRALDRVPVNERLAWILRHVEGEDLAGVAARCEVSLATAKRRIAAAADRLRLELTK